MLVILGEGDSTTTHGSCYLKRAQQSIRSRTRASLDGLRDHAVLMVHRGGVSTKLQVLLFTENIFQEEKKGSCKKEEKTKGTSSPGRTT